MRDLILLRHAKTEPGGIGLADRKRALTDRGRSDARLVGDRIKAEGWLPDRILCSPATRTRQTLDALIAAFGSSPPTDFPEALYGARSPDYLKTIATAGGSARRLMVIGHNPTIHATARAAATSGDRALRERIAEKFPTAAFVLIAFQIDDWSEIGMADGRLLAFVTPRDLGGGGAD
jgi:phosphohistidine phosphatase